MDLYLYSEEDFSDEGDQPVDDPNVSISNRIIEALTSKTEKHNRGCEQGCGVTLDKVKSVYVKGCDNRFNPDKTLNECGLARVNMFLSISKGTSIGEFFDEPINSDSLNEITSLVLEDENNIICSSAFDVLEEWHPSKSFFLEAQKDIEQYNLDLSFDNVSDLYLEVEDQNQFKNWIDY